MSKLVETKVHPAKAVTAGHKTLHKRINGLPMTAATTIWSKNKISFADICIRGRGERLARLRTMLGLTLDRAARISHISRPELSRLENETRRLTEVHLGRLAKTFRLPVTELKDILDYDIDTRVQLLASEKSAPQQSACQLRLIPASTLFKPASRKIAGFCTISLHMESALSKEAYSIEIDDITDSVYPPQTQIIADPNKTVRIGELVVNTIGKDPLLIQLYRNTKGILCGTSGDVDIEFTRSVTLKDFHKVVAILPAPEISTTHASGQS